MTTIHFVRHGETEWNRLGRLQGSRDIPLNEVGRSQARQLARAWDWAGDLLVASPQSRAFETATILGNHWGLEVSETDPRLVERSFGEAEGLSLADRHERFPDGQIPGLEPHDRVRERAHAFLETIHRTHPGRRVLAVSHGGFINAVLALVSHGEVGTGKTTLDNLSVSQVTWSDGHWRVVSVGQTLVPASAGLKE